MIVEQAQASSIEVNKTPSRQRTAVASGSQNSQFGIKAKLFLAFFSLAALTALASAVAWYVFRDIDRAVTRITVESVPGIVIALSSAEKSAEIAAAAPAANGCRQSRGASSGRSKIGGASTRVSHSDRGSHCLARGARKNARTFEN